MGRLLRGARPHVGALARVGQRGFEAVAAPPPPVLRNPPVPSDVADAGAVRRYLEDSEGIFGDPAEGRGYLDDAFDRFRLTLGMVPNLSPGSRVLELGSNPYFLTRLLRRRHLDVTSANWFGADFSHRPRVTQVITIPSTGAQETFDFDHFNIETDPFPYPDGTFDVVLFCEILEHLPCDPVHVLAEIHRVLAQPHGRIVVTTPNATRAENLVKMINGDNVYEVLSGNGVYGRHNREYTVAELSSLLDACGFVNIDVRCGDVHAAPPRWARSVGVASLADRGDTLFASAQARGEPRWPYPDWLFSSRLALRRVVRPDMLVGVNDDLQLSGAHQVEGTAADRWRWTGDQPMECLLAAGTEGARSIRVEGVGPPVGPGRDLRLSIELAGTVVETMIAADGRPFAVELPVTAEAGDHAARLRTDRTWRPLGGDPRSLGFQIKRVAFGAGPGA
ncbi:MAG: class I SAM-dependent methyltransferase [Acidimicrobiales bacterium]